MKFSTTGKIWFGMLFADAVATFADEMRASRERRERFHGYRWAHATEILTMILTAHPDYCAHFKRLSDAEQARNLHVLFTMPPDVFRRAVGFDRPSPY
jgi:hypothetical protein